MKDRTLPELSKSELDIMKILWKDGRLSAREVHDQISPTYNWAYSTTKTIMDRMVNKNLLSRRNFHGVFLYEPLITKPMGLAKLVRNFADHVLEMDYGSVVSLFARSKALTPKEIEELCKLLDSQNK
ncbi:BlaI/MecI/CopY family transcriptional regulator [candidate division KSB1 bacterium]|nr:BlaI/MecI/CopY family transcriptional regulator [candidate division KSB1 bacterium]NIR69171.1 BlaI/MecI/CopY family transcriptional regulator [candidate division KSB1 bacterium]NIS25682.1 BlaI/MecI/CopY family transcriptional regulator [candidate division KSB1 bacterium]NIT72550.1 BlaI/MecI/CopY family transcriptional regulator [candidate division KSB1 bacterium]NIU26359.1 BlaI/MecI/CopY family transcriptional regulator [candidate division KSB1 bacterium]